MFCNIFKFDQNFKLKLNDEILNYQVTVVTGNDIDNPQNYNFAIAYFGYVFIDGIPTKFMTRENIYELFDMILQDTWLFDGTI